MTTRRKRDKDDARRLRAAMRPILAARLDALWSAEAAARALADPEGVHDMRTASRRLRAALDASREAFPAAWFARLRGTIRALTRALGEVRDAEVLLALLDDRRGPGARPGVDRLVARLTSERDDARVHLFARLDDLDRRGTRDELRRRFRRASTASPPDLRQRDRRRLLVPSARAYLERADTLPARDDAAGLHELRIAARRLRHTLEIIGPLPGDTTGRTPAQLAALQDRLGELHNLDVLIDLTRRELHTLLDETIDQALETGRDATATDAAATDLRALLADVARERRARYDAVLETWDTLQADGLNDAIRALAGAPE